MFGLFIVSCGFTHFLEVVTFYDPMYRLSGLIKLLTALVSWATVLGLVRIVPLALALRSPAELEREIAERKKAEELLQRAHQGLEARVGERTAELAEANGALQAEIAERRRAEADREQILAREQQARAEAEMANRTKDEFLATLSHELRTPLNAMFGWVHLLRTGKLDAATVERGLEVLDRNTRAQAQLIDDLLDMSRIVTGKLRLEVRPTELAPVVQAALDAIRPAAEARGVRLSAALSPDAGPVSGDPTRLQQVVWNLLANAVKFTPRDGWVEVRLERAGTQVQVEVRDSGQGVKAEMLPHLFERFFQADSTSTRTHGGLGLGLAIVRHLVELHGGTASAHSAGEGQGATFTVRLPVLAVRMGPSSPERPGPQAAWKPAPGAGIRGLRVLVVDDEADAREMLALVLAQGGALVTAVGSVREALDALEAGQPDVLVSDVDMPEEGGYALIQQVRARSRERGGQVPAVALTAHARAEDRTRILAAGFQMHAPKPIDPDELAAVIQSLANRTGRS